MLCTWFLTVGTSMLSRPAICLLESPLSSSATISSSRTVKRPRRPPSRRRSPRGDARDALQQDGSDVRRAVKVSANDALERRDQLTERLIPRNEARHACLGVRNHLVRLLKIAERDHLQRRELRDQPQHGGPGAGQCDVHQQHVGLGRTDVVVHCGNVGSCGDHGHGRLTPEDLRETLSEQTDADRNDDCITACPRQAADIA